MGVTDDPNDPRLTHGPDLADSGYHEQAGTYLVLSAKERAKGFVRPVRRSYWHLTCGKITFMAPLLRRHLLRALRPAPTGRAGWRVLLVRHGRPGRQAPSQQPKVGT